MTKGVYCLTFPNGKRYVGISLYSIEDRFKHYKNLNCKKQSRLFNALKKYGPENVEFNIILQSNDKTKVLKVENQLISIYNLTSKKYGYNILSGGSHIPFHSDKEKLSKIHKERIRNKRDTFSEEWRRKISEANTGRTLTEKHKRKISEANKNKIITDKTRNKMSISAKNRKKDTRKTGKSHHFSGVNGVYHPASKLITIQNIETGQIDTGCCAELSRKHKFNSCNMSSKGYSKGWKLINKEQK